MASALPGAAYAANDDDRHRHGLVVIHDDDDPIDADTPRPVQLRADRAAQHLGLRVTDIERLPFDLSALEGEGAFINVDARNFGLLDRRLDWHALGVTLPRRGDLAFRPPRCGLVPDRYRLPLLRPASRAHAALQKFSYHFRLVETVFESPSYRWMPWRAWSAFERDFNAAQGQLRTALDAYDTDYLTIRETVLEVFRQLAADSARRLGATGHEVPPDFEDAVVQEVLAVLPTPELLRQRLTLRYRVGVMLLGSEMLAEQRVAAQERRNLEAIESERRLAESQVVAQERAIQERLWAEQERVREQRGLYVLCDYGGYLAPDGLPDPILVRQLRELAWAVKTRAVTVLFAGPTFPEIPTLEKEIKMIELPLPDGREVERILDLRLHQLRESPEARVHVDEHAHEQLSQALLGLTETDIDNALANAAITLGGINAEALPLVLDEKRSVIRQSGSLTYSHPELADHLGGYTHLRQLLHGAAATFTPAVRAFGVEPHKGLLLVGLPGCGKDLCKKVAGSVLGRALLDLDFGAVMGEGGGVIGSAAMSIRRALSIATTLKGILGISEFEKGVGGLQSSAHSDAGETARTIAFLLNWMQEQSDVFVFATANDVRQLAPEQIRQGRFGQVVFVDLPTVADRAAIFRVHLSKRGRDPDAFDTEALSATAEGFSGAEIEAAVK